MGYMCIVSDHFCNTFVVEIAKHYTTDHALRDKELFSRLKYASYATDVTFQQGSRPSGNMQDVTVYFSGKHKLCGLKVEVSVLRNRLSIGCPQHYPGSTVDVHILYRNVYLHLAASTKSEDRKQLADLGPLVHEHPDY